MKRSWLLSISLGLALVLAVVGLAGCSPGTARVEELPSSLKFSLNTRQEGIWVSGMGEVTVTPEIATLRLGIVSQEADGIQERDIAVITAR